MDDTNTYHICADDRVAVLGAIAIGKPILNSLLNGAAQYPLDRRDDSLPHLVDWLVLNDITIFVSLPSAFRNPLSDLSGREICPALRLIRLGSESLYRSDVELYKKYFNADCVLVHSYGSNETNTISDYLITQDLEIIGHRVPVGYPRNNVKILVVDAFGKKVPISHPGEIVVNSRFLSSGYWQQGKLTSDRLHASSTAVREREYFTGDIGCLSEDGCLEHLGRNNSIVKIRGVGVDVSEIEARLLHRDGVREAIVLPNEVRPAEVILIVYVVPSSTQTPSAANLQAFLVDSLLDYMIPSDFLTLDHFPLTATGKLDRRALPDFGKSRPELILAYVAPATPIERDLERIWAEQNQTKLAGDVEIAQMLSEVETMTDKEADAAVTQLDREGKS